MILLWILLGIAAFLILLLSLNVSLILQYREKIEISLSLPGIRIPLYPQKEKKVKISDYSLRSIEKRKRKEQKKALKKTKKKTKTATASKEQPKKRSVSQNLRIIRALAAPLSKRFFGHLRLKTSCIRISVATGDAASTAILFGVVNQSVVYLLEILDSFGSLHKSGRDRISVTPDYTSSKTTAYIKLVFSLRTHRIFDILFQTLKLYLMEKSKKNK